MVAGMWQGKGLKRFISLDCFLNQLLCTHPFHLKYFARCCCLNSHIEIDQSMLKILD